MTDRAALLRRYRELVLDELPRDLATGPALTQAVRAAAHLVALSQPARQL